MYSNHSHAYFEVEEQDRGQDQDGTLLREVRLGKWDCKVEEIEGVAIGGSWAAIATKNAIRVFSYGGSELHSICFDRVFLTMAAYEDLLVVAYNSALPLGESNIFEFKAYAISGQSFRLLRQSALPVRTE
jgi:hypothetical protein